MTGLQIEGVVKYRGGRQTVSNVSLSINAGERIALLGHNGAGKTTLLRMVLGLTQVDEGHISILGHQPGSLEAKRLTAYLPENVDFHRTLSAKEVLRHFARLKGDTNSRADDLLERVGLTADADRKIATFSKGMRQRLGLAQALLGRPTISLLDEPTSGLDPIARAEFYELIGELASAGGSVLISSHALTEMEASTDRIAILRAGKLVANDNIGALRRATRLPIRIRVAARTDSAEALIAQIGGRRVNGCSVELICDAEEKMAMLASVNSVQHLVEDIDIVPPDLDDLYRYFNDLKDNQL